MFAKAVGLLSEEDTPPFPLPGSEGMEHNNTFPPNFERRHRFFPINLLWWELVLPLLPVLPADGS